MSRVIQESSSILNLPTKSAEFDHFGLTLRRWASSKISRPIHVLSLFSGAGGLDIGFHDAGFTIHTMIEIDPRFIDTLQRNCGPGRYFENGSPVRQDINKYRPKADMPVDFIIGGPPCQTFSAAGRRMAGVRGTGDVRGVLFKQYVRILKKLSPKGFLFENVYGLTGAQNGEAWKQIKKAFARAGYKVSFHVLDAADYGVPQHRKRLFIVGTKAKPYAFPKPLYGPNSPDNQPYITAGQVLADVTLTRAEKIRLKVNGKYGKLLNDIPPGLNYAFYTEKMGHPRPIFAWRSKFFDFLYKADPKAPVKTLKARGGQYTGPFHWRSRRFAISEMKRLQTMPDSYDIVGGRQIVVEQIGNSVPPQLARILALTILNQVFKIELPFTLPLLEETQSLKIRQQGSLLTKAYGKKAQVAITKNKHKYGVKRAKKATYSAFLSEDFGWTFSKHEAALHIDFTPSKAQWLFAISLKLPSDKEELSITIEPTPGMNWGLKVDRVILVGAELTPKIFTGAWKAFELELVRHEIKADLVQLCGYYQYSPAFQCSMQYYSADTKDEWRIVQLVVNGTGVGKIYSSYMLSKFWNIPQGKVLHYASYLRSLGYEVRNQNTNPQIPKGHFLIPYMFPTLSPLSVQLSKKLEKIYGGKK
jgi:DNA (cytosine-5)-methyltransferase 1